MALAVNTHLILVGAGSSIDDMISHSFGLSWSTHPCVFFEYEVLREHFIDCILRLREARRDLFVELVAIVHMQAWSMLEGESLPRVVESSEYLEFVRMVERRVPLRLPQPLIAPSVFNKS